MTNEEERSGTGRPPGEDKEQISPRLPLSLIERLRRSAERNKRTLSAEVEIAIERHLEREERQIETSR